MKLIYSGSELRDIDSAIPKAYWDGVDKDIQVDETYYFVYNYNKPNTHGVLEDMRVIAKARLIDIEKGLDKGTELARAEGYSDKMSLIKQVYLSSIVPGICVKDDCSYTKDVEPDQDRGYCEVCNTQTVESILILEGAV